MNAGEWMTESQRRKALEDEYDDLTEEMFDCGDQAERCRCAIRMNAIITELSCLCLPTVSTTRTMIAS